MNSSLIHKKLTDPKEYFKTHIGSEEFQSYYNVIKINEILGNRPITKLRISLFNKDANRIIAQTEFNNEIIVLEYCTTKNDDYIGPVRFSQFLYDTMQLTPRAKDNIICNHGYSDKYRKWFYWDNKNVYMTDQFSNSEFQKVSRRTP